MTKAHQFFLVLIAIAGAAGFSGCATSPAAVRVKPWERGYLADATMDPNRDPLGTAA